MYDPRLVEARRVARDQLQRLRDALSDGLPARVEVALQDEHGAEAIWARWSVGTMTGWT